MSSWTHGKDDMQVRLDFRHKEVKHFLGCSMVVQCDIALFLSVDADLFRHKDLVVRAEQTRNFILVDEIVHILQHEASLKLVICEQESTFFEVTACHV